jgi:predicted ATPase
MTVLIGENGAGKSTILECLELLRKATEPNFLNSFYTIHRGLPGLLRKGASALELGVRIEDDSGQLPSVSYTFGVSRQGTGIEIHRERLALHPYEDPQQVSDSTVLLRMPGQALTRIPAMA